MGVKMLREDVYARMARYRYGVVCSTNCDGMPQSALVGIAVTPALEIVFDTLSGSRKYANLTDRPACSFVLGGRNDRWSEEQTAQFEGRAFVPDGDSLEVYQQLYFQLWQDGRARRAWAEIAYVVVRQNGNGGVITI